LVTRRWIVALEYGEVIASVLWPNSMPAHDRTVEV